MARSCRVISSSRFSRRQKWEKIRDFLRDDPNTYVGRDESACLSYVEAVI
jgi:hypothetical protein